MQEQGEAIVGVAADLRSPAGCWHGSPNPDPSPNPNPNPDPHQVRPDVLPQPALVELSKMQDGVEGFEQSIAIAMVEQELGRPLMEVFSEFADEPVAAASLAQVYRAVLRDGGDVVAVKVQRPGVQSLVSKDLYVLRRAAEVYQGLIKRFAPQQRTDYVALLNEWAVGFYTELDFKNEVGPTHGDQPHNTLPLATNY